MTNDLITLAVYEPRYAEIRDIIAQTPEGLETGVTLFGTRTNGLRVALFAVGPGSRAVHTPGFHEPDADHVNREFDRLRASFPSLEWIGSLHVHPFGMTGLSGHDRGTVAKLFAMHPDRLHLPDFIAGIIQRRQGRFAVYPYLLEPNGSLPWLVPIQILAEDAPAIREAEERARIPQPLAHSAETPATGSNMRSRTRNALGRLLRPLPSLRRICASPWRKDNDDAK